MPWAQGVGRSNRPAPTMILKGLFAIRQRVDNVTVVRFVAVDFLKDQQPVSY